MYKILPSKCTTQDVLNANIETIYNSFKMYEKKQSNIGYSYEVLLEMSEQLVLYNL